MKVIGITGGVGSGKTQILTEIQKKFTCRIIISDLVAKELEQKGGVCYAALVNLLGIEVLDSAGEIDKKKMASLIFSDDSLLEKVNDIIHPAVKEYILNEIDAAKKNKEELFFIEAALLIECGYNEIVDEMWFIYTSDEERRKRLKASRGYSDEKIDSIIKSQLSYEEYKKNSDFIVDNSFSIDETINQIVQRLK